MKQNRTQTFWGSIWTSFMTVILCTSVFMTDIFAVKSYAADFRYPLDDDGELIVVLDPGHGGENLGADYNGFLEKEMNMIVANAMYEELTKYEGITVYMTRTEDVDVSLRKRAEFARDVDADFLFCLHFNMSANNNLYGSEVWVELRGDENRQGYAFANVQLAEMAELGLFIRGVKTRIGENGKDYYGILRHCKEFGIAAALIEHCHVDNDKDTGFCDSREDLEALGRADATAAAKYFGLSSKELGVDYSDYELPVTIDKKKEYVLHDTTEPEVSALYLEECDYENRKVTVTFRATDKETAMLYYDYSVDGAETFSQCYPWPEADMIAGTSSESFRFTIAVEPGTTPRIVARAYNKYDRYTASNVLNGFSAFPEEAKETENEEEGALTEPAPSENVGQGINDILEKGEFIDVSKELSPEEETGGSLIYVLLLALVGCVAGYIGVQRKKKKR